MSPEEREHREMRCQCLGQRVGMSSEEKAEASVQVADGWCCIKSHQPMTSRLNPESH